MMPRVQCTQPKFKRWLQDHLVSRRLCEPQSLSRTQQVFACSALLWMMCSQTDRNWVRDTVCVSNLIELKSPSSTKDVLKCCDKLCALTVARL